MSGHSLRMIRVYLHVSLASSGLLVAQAEWERPPSAGHSCAWVLQAGSGSPAGQSPPHVSSWSGGWQHSLSQVPSASGLESRVPIEK